MQLEAVMPLYLHLMRSDAPRCFPVRQARTPEVSNQHTPHVSHGATYSSTAAFLLQPLFLRPPAQNRGDLSALPCPGSSAELRRGTAWCRTARSRESPTR